MAYLRPQTGQGAKGVRVCTYKPCVEKGLRGFRVCLANPKINKLYLQPCVETEMRKRANASNRSRVEGALVARMKPYDLGAGDSSSCSWIAFSKAASG